MVKKTKLFALFNVVLTYFLFGAVTSEPREDPMSSNLTLLRISNLLGAHHRLSVGINLLADIITPNPISALSQFSGVKRDFIEDFFQSDWEELIGELKNIQTDNIKVDDLMKSAQVIDEVKGLLENTPQATKSNKTEAGVVFSDWMKFSTVDISVLDDLVGKMGALNNYDLKLYDQSGSVGGLQSISIINKLRPVMDEASEAIKKFPGEVSSQMYQLKKLSGIHYFEEIFSPIRISILVFEKMENKLSISEETVTKITKAIDDAAKLRESTKSISSILKLAQSENPSSPVTTLLQGDLHDRYLKECLADGNELSILEGLLQPIFKIGSFFSEQWDEIHQKATTLKEGSMKLDSMLRSLGDTDALNLNSDLKEVLDCFGTTTDPIIQKFLTLFKSVADGIDAYRQLQEDISDFEESAHYETASKPSGFDVEVTKIFKEIKRTLDDSSFDKLKTNPIFVGLKDSFEGTVKKMKEFNVLAQKVHSNFQNLIGWEQTVTEMEKWLKENLESKTKQVKEALKVTKEVKAAGEFIKAHQALGDMDTFATGATGLQADIKKTLEQISGKVIEFKKLSDSKSYQNIIWFSETVKLSDKLYNGKILFELFHRFLKDEDKFQKVFKMETGLGPQMSHDDPIRYEFIRSFKKLNDTSRKVREMKTQILKRKRGYDGVSNLELLDLIRLVENLDQIVNPEYRTSEWLDFVNSLPDTLDSKQELQDLITSTFDLDFAAHQVNLTGTHEGLMTLLALHLDLVTKHLIEKDPSLWAKSGYWLGPVLVVIGAVVIYVPLAIIVKCHLMRQAKKRKNETS